MTDSVEDEDQWVVRLKNESLQADALTDLRAILMRGLSRAFAGKGGGESFCEDVAQETLIRILNKLDQFSGRSRFTTWAMSIAVRIGTSQFRRKMYKDVSLNFVESDENLRLEFSDESIVSPEIFEDRQALVQTLKQLICSKLTERQRHATEAIMRGIPIEEIAERTESNRNAVYKLIHDARVRLKVGLELAGYSADDVLATIA